MKRSFFSNLAFLLLLNALIKPFWLFGIEVSVQNAVGAAAYGLYYSVLNLTFMFNILLDFGINNYNNRQVARSGEINPHTFISLLLLRAGLAIFYMLFTVLVAWILGYGVEHLFFLGWLVVNQVLVSFIQFFRSNLSGLHLFRRDSIVSVLDRAILIVFLGGLLWWGFTERPFQIGWFVLGQTGAYAVACIVAALFCLGRVNLQKWKFRRKKMIALLHNSFPFALLTLLMMLYYKIDGVMIERILNSGAQQAGVYAQSYRLLEAGNIIGFLFAGLLLPIFSRLLKEQEHSEIQRLISSCARWLIVPAVMVWILSMFFAEELMGLMYVAHVKESAAILKWLMGSYVCLSSGYIFGTLITASGMMRNLNIMAGLTLMVNVVLNLLLIPALKAEGAAVASLVSMLVMALGQVIISKPLYGSVIYMQIAKYLLMLVISGSFVFGVQQMGLLSWEHELMLSIVGMVVLFLLFGGIKKSDLRQFSSGSE